MTKDQKQKAEKISAEMTEEEIILKAVESLEGLKNCLLARKWLSNSENWTAAKDAENYEKLVEATAAAVLSLNILNCKIDIKRPRYEALFNEKLNRLEKSK